jgi:hypothetical protein
VGGGIRAHIAQEQQVVDDGRQAEAGAGSVLSLVQHQALGGIGGQQAGHVRIAGPGRGQAAQQRRERAVAQVQAVGPRVQGQAALADHHILGGHGGSPPEHPVRVPGC